ncbi:hypothetical protein HK405_006133 [Cladochytrium tenue]|nr:hypothetical protein HK405_006133 [Cladochytrium tenue]
MHKSASNTRRELRQASDLLEQATAASATVAGRVFTGKDHRDEGILNSLGAACACYSGALRWSPRRAATGPFDRANGPAAEASSDHSLWAQALAGRSAALEGLGLWPLALEDVAEVVGDHSAGDGVLMEDGAERALRRRRARCMWWMWERREELRPLAATIARLGPASADAAAWLFERDRNATSRGSPEQELRKTLEAVGERVPVEPLHGTSRSAELLLSLLLTLQATRGDGSATLSGGEVGYDPATDRRYLVAVKDLVAGDVVLEERPVFVSLFAIARDERCDQCAALLLPNPLWFPCSFGLDDAQWRIVLQVALEMSKVREHADIKSNPERYLARDGTHATVTTIAIEALWRPLDRALESSERLAMFRDAVRLRKGVEEAGCKSLPGPDELVDLAYRVRCNAFTVRAPPSNSRPQAENGNSAGSRLRRLEADIGGDGTVAIATALFLGAASFANHSCRPNAVVTFAGPDGRLVLRAAADIRRRAEVTVSYGPLVARAARDRRVAATLDAWMFECECEACSGRNRQGDELHLYLDAYRCSRASCSHPVQLDDLKCPECGTPFLSEGARTATSRAEEAVTAAVTAASNSNDEGSFGDQARWNLSAAKKELLRVCHPLSFRLARFYSDAAETLMALGDAAESARHLERAFPIVVHQFGGFGAVETLRELPRLAERLLAAGRRADAAERAREALRGAWALQPDEVALAEAVLANAEVAGGG